MQHRPGQITPDAFGEPVVTYYDVDTIPTPPASLVNDALTAVTRLAQAFQPGVADVLAERLRARPNDAGVLDLDEAAALLGAVGRVLSEPEEPQIPVWDEDLDLPPPGDDALERVLALLQTDANLCAQLRRELALLP
jgi:hypothetical protein